MNKLTRARVGNLSSGIYRMEVTVFKYKHARPLRAIKKNKNKNKNKQKNSLPVTRGWLKLGIFFIFQPETLASHKLYS